MKLNEKQIAQMRELREQGETWAKIGKMFGVSATTAHCYLDPNERERLNEKCRQRKIKMVRKRAAEDKGKARRPKHKLMKLNPLPKLPKPARVLTFLESLYAEREALERQLIAVIEELIRFKEQKNV